jgi:hypothetical protein
MFSHAEMSFVGIVGWLLVIILIRIRIAVHGLMLVILLHIASFTMRQLFPAPSFFSTM